MSISEFRIKLKHYKVYLSCSFSGNFLLTGGGLLVGLLGAGLESKSSEALTSLRLGVGRPGLGTGTILAAVQTDFLSCSGCDVDTDGVSKRNK